MNTVLTAKSALRWLLRDKIKGIPADIKASKSLEICRSIVRDGLIVAGSNVLVYKALPSEVNVDYLIDYALGLGANVYLPRVNGSNIDIARYGGEFEVGAYGILEPTGSSCEVDMDIIILPLLGVTMKGDRLGKGGGYYDRYLVRSSGFKVAVAFAEQVVEDLPTESHDVSVDKVYTA